MKNHIRYLAAAAGLLVIWPAAWAADDKPETKTEKKPMRVLAAPERETRVFVQRASDQREKAEMETVAFLGVETGTVSATTSAQLGLPRGTGLVVNQVFAKSAASGVLNEHDILLKLDDQILIETRQLSVLIRTHKEGDEVTLTYLRGGQKSSAKVKLGKTEVPKTTAGWEGGNRFEFFTAPIGGESGRTETDRVLSMIPRSPSGDPLRIQIDHNAGPGIRAMAVHTGNSNMVFNDGEGTLELTTKDGVKALVATDLKGAQLFSGPINTPEERKALPAGVRERVEKLEGMHDISFRTDGDFRGTGTRVMRPRGITLPLPPSAPVRSLAPAFF